MGTAHHPPETLRPGCRNNDHPGVWIQTIAAVRGRCRADTEEQAPASSDEETRRARRWAGAAGLLQLLPRRRRPSEHRVMSMTRPSRPIPCARRSLFGFLVTIAACSSAGGGGTPAYAPCDGKAAACLMATRFGGASGEGCLCTYYCKVDSDCPTPATGTARPVCQPYGDLIVNGQTADCRLPCDASTVCPDGMSCSVSGCIGALGK